MIDVVTSHDLLHLAETTAEHCVSLFLPTHRTGPEQVQDPIRLKNLVNRAETELCDLGMKGRHAERLLAPATALEDDADFWHHQEKGLAAYLTSDSLTTYRLPDPVDELVVTADRFHVKPVIPSLATGTAFHVLALSQHQIRLLRGTRAHVAEIEVGDDIPHSLAEALWWDDRERQVQHRAASRTGRGVVTATFHGHGGGKDTAKADLARFFRAVDDGITHLIGNSPATPLVLAGVEYLLAIYRSISRYPRIIDASIEGNPDQLSADQLHGLAWGLMEPVLDRYRAAATEQFLASGTPTGFTLRHVLPAAANGRVADLFVPADQQQWGSFDPATQHLDEHDIRQPGDRDLLDTAALDTLVHGGRVFAVPAADVPGEGPLAATFRY